MIAQQIVNALMLGSTYALIALGYTLVFGVLNMLNFAHPNIFAMGGVLLFAGLTMFGLPLPLAMVFSIVGTMLLGLATELLSFRPSASRKDELAPAMSSIAFGLVIVEVAAKIWGPDPVRLPTLPGTELLGMGPVQVSPIQLGILGLSLVLMVGVDAVLQRTKVGYALRAVAERREVAALLGVNVQWTIVAAFAISAALAGLAGILLAMRIGLADPNVGLSFGLRALAVMVIGGLGNIRGAMLAGMLVGFVDVMTLAFLSQAYSGIAAWVLLLLVLMFRPSGLLGTRVQRQGI